MSYLDKILKYDLSYHELTCIITSLDDLNHLWKDIFPMIIQFGPLTNFCNIQYMCKKLAYINENIKRFAYWTFLAKCENSFLIIH
jgi:hypothetical protein